ncbi:MAG: DUF2141 domain-containing protein [Aureibaculum sp.]
MVRIVTLLVLYLVSQLVGAQNSADTISGGAEINVTVPNVTSDHGKVLFALYTKDTFLKQPEVGEMGGIENGISTVTFKNVMAGEYAIVCFHDSNSNEKLDFSEDGIPIEDFGSSAKVKRMGPPSFEDSKIKIENKSLDLTIKF